MLKFDRGTKMIKIKDKKDSILKMREMNLNTMPCEVFTASDGKGIKAFFEQNPAEEYILRSTDKAQGEFFFVRDFEEAKEKLERFEDHVTVAVSFRPYAEDIILIGDVQVSRKAGGDEVDITATTQTDGTHRGVYENPEFNIHASLEEDRVWRIPGFSKLMRYISEHELYDVIVEFAVYDMKVGKNKENVLISELRTGY